MFFYFHGKEKYVQNLSVYIYFHVEVFIFEDIIIFFISFMYNFFYKKCNVDNFLASVIYVYNFFSTTTYVHNFFSNYNLCVYFFN
jgi:hypothetical protein